MSREEYAKSAQDQKSRQQKGYYVGEKIDNNGWSKIHEHYFLPHDDSITYDACFFNKEEDKFEVFRDLSLINIHDYYYSGYITHIRKSSEVRPNF